MQVTADQRDGGHRALAVADGEAIGLLGVSYIAELAPGWWLGPAIYGACSGDRGGLFTWGVEGQRRWRPAARWQLGAGLYVGGGGGAGAPVGGGLMLRPHADLLRDFGGWSAGISASQVRFPNGSIHSTQLGLLVAVNDTFAYLAPGHGGQQVDFSGAGGLGADRVSLIAGRYATAADRGTPVRTVGMQLQRQLGPILSATLEAAGAATGEADGYAEFLAGALALWPVGDGPLRLGLRAAVGLGGGGAVPTGGGPIAKAAVVGVAAAGSQLSLGLEAGRARAFDGAFNSRYAQLTLGLAFADGAAAADATTSDSVVHDMQWAVSAQQYLHARRDDGSAGSLSTLGLKFQRALGENLYLSAQAHSAVAGGAGAYSAGMTGPGREPASGRCRAMERRRRGTDRRGWGWRRGKPWRRAGAADGLDPARPRPPQPPAAGRRVREVAARRFVERGLRPQLGAGIRRAVARRSARRQGRRQAAAAGYL